MRHAYLILAHNNVDQLSKLVSLLDDKSNDIFIHIDKKSDITLQQVNFKLIHSNIYVFKEINIFWGDYSMIEAELLLFEKSSKFVYDYYHLLSGADLPIKSMTYIQHFFEKNKGKEFVFCSEDFSNQKQVKRRAKYYYHLQKNRKNKNKYIEHSINFMNKVDIFIQMIFRINRVKKFNMKIMAGSQWISITNDFLLYVLEHKQLIKDMFTLSNCSDELFIQTLLYNSDFKHRLYLNKNNKPDNMRKILWEDNNSGSPYVWRKKDYNCLIQSTELFARKFDDRVDKEIIDLICEYVCSNKE